MPLLAGARIGAYKIFSLLGQGGMGAVYRAHDTKLNRDVALKVLLPEVADNAERLARFRREAQILASLNHPNIAHIYGLEESDGIVALVLELVEGPTLADRIAKGPIPLDEALAIAKQIAEALECAHEHRFIHRDLKPANIKVREDGTVKVLDFGLARAMEPVAATGLSAGAMTNSPTITSPALMTGVGVLLGTAAYMSPEQAKGNAADKRSDIWAFGCVCYEMLTGRRAFEGDDVTETLASVVKTDPDWVLLPRGVPSAVDRMLRAALQKDRRKRLGDVAAVLFALDETRGSVRDTSLPSFSGLRRWIWGGVAAGTLIAGAGLGLAVTRAVGQAQTVPPVMEFQVLVGDGHALSGRDERQLTLSIDGTKLVYSADTQLWLRRMSDVSATPIRGSQGFANPTNPVFSPDGEWIAFFDGDHQIKTIPVSGGTPVNVCDTIGHPYGLDWRGDTILFSDGGMVARVPARGGIPETIVKADEDEVVAAPRFLAAGDAVVFTTTKKTDPPQWDDGRIVAQSLRSSDRHVIVDRGTDASELTKGLLSYMRGNIVFAVPFDVNRLQRTGEPVPVFEGVRRNQLGGNRVDLWWAGQYATSASGTLAFIPGAAAQRFGIALFDRTGALSPLKLDTGPWRTPRVSPDGTRVAVASDDGRDAHIWLFDPTGPDAARRLTTEGYDRYPVWTRDGSRLAYQSQREHTSGIYWQRVDGVGPVERLTTAEPGTAHVPEAFTPDGTTLLYRTVSSAGITLWRVGLGDRKTERFGDVTSISRTVPSVAFSPDGHWFAYAEQRDPQSAEAVFVQPYPPTGTKQRVSKNAGHHPVWSRDGTELFFTPSSGARLTAVHVRTAPTFAFGDEIPVTRPFWNDGPSSERPYNTTADSRFIALSESFGSGSEDAVQVAQIHVVLNWSEELKQRVPTR